MRASAAVSLGAILLFAACGEGPADTPADGPPTPRPTIEQAAPPPSPTGAMAAAAPVVPREPSATGTAQPGSREIPTNTASPTATRPGTPSSNLRPPPPVGATPAPEPTATPMSIPASTVTPLPAAPPSRPPPSLEVGSEEGKLAPDYVMRLIDGSTIDSESLVKSGRPVFLFFFATW